MIGTETDMNLNRRTFVAGAGSSLGAAGLSTTAGVDEEESSGDDADEPVAQNVEFEYSYQSEVPDKDLDDRLELSSAEYFLGETGTRGSCHITFDVENLTDDEEMTVYLVSRVENDDGDDQSSHERPIVSVPGESKSVDLSFPECIEADRGEVHAMVTSINMVEDDEPGGDDPESFDVEFEYEYDADIQGREDVDLESKLELSSAEFFRVAHDGSQDYCYVEVEAENLTDDTELSLDYGAVVDEEMTSVGASGDLDAGETTTVRIELYNCNNPDPDEGVVSAFAGNMWVDGEEDEEPDDEPEDETPEDDEPEESEDDEPEDDECPEDEPGPEVEEDCPEDEPEPEPEEENC
jgi:hypothetical protein